MVSFAPLIVFFYSPKNDLRDARKEAFSSLVMDAMRSWGLRAERNASLSSALSEARKAALSAPDITDIPANKQCVYVYIGGGGCFFCDGYAC